ncbi:MAG: NAD(P)/FAD-dependent oxidoreductase [Pseudorhodobacter sp.]
MDTDFIIIGGGIAGVSAAARLAPFGSVTLLEAEAALAHHASGRSAALYEPRYGSPPVVALSLASDAYFRQADGVLSERGLMLLAREEEAEEFAHDLQSMDFTEITPDEAIAMVPVLNRDVIARAGFAAHAWDIDTDLLVQGFARTARAARARIVTGAQVSALSRDGAGWRIASSAGDFSARMVVNAAGAWVDEIAKLAGIRPLGFQPYRRSMARIPAPGGHDVSRWPMIFGAGETWYAKPDAGALIVSPAEEHPMPPHDAWADDMVLAEGLARYEEFVTEPVTRLLANWAGLRTFAPDRSLVIGPDAREPSFFWLAGQGGQGFQSCPAASQLAADLIAGRAPEVGADVVAAVAPGRFG